MSRLERHSAAPETAEEVEPSPRRCSLCKGSGGTVDVPCVPCFGSGWRVGQTAVEEAPKPPENNDLSDEIPF